MEFKRSCITHASWHNNSRTFEAETFYFEVQRRHRLHVLFRNYIRPTAHATLVMKTKNVDTLKFVRQHKFCL